jgi:hypothetical protein
VSSRCHLCAHHSRNAVAVNIQNAAVFPNDRDQRVQRAKNIRTLKR